MPDVAIEMRGVEKRFEGRTTVHALTAIDLEIRDSEFAVLLWGLQAAESRLS